MFENINKIQRRFNLASNIKQGRTTIQFPVFSCSQLQSTGKIYQKYIHISSYIYISNLLQNPVKV